MHHRDAICTEALIRQIGWQQELRMDKDLQASDDSVAIAGHALPPRTDVVLRTPAAERLQGRIRDGITPCSAAVAIATCATHPAMLFVC